MRAWYAALLGLRVLLALAPSPSTIHPDEFRQSADVASAWLHGTAEDLPWEFNAAHLARSYTGVVASVGPSIGLASVLNWPGAWMLWTVRLWSLALTVVGDWAFYQACKDDDALLLRASSWVSLVLLARTFSNSLEALVLDALLCVAAMAPSTRSATKRGAIGGALVAFGFFVRITFCAFAFAIVLYAVHEQWAFDRQARNKKPQASSLVELARRQANTVRFLASSAAGALAVGAACVAVDSLVVGAFVVAPVNNLAYNVQSSNLAKHGLHPRYTHVLVNAQLMFGPLFLLALYRVGVAAAAALATTARAMDMSRQQCMHAGVIVFGLSALSLFPHQEPRFLAPLLSSMCLLAPRSVARCPRVFWWPWLAFNMALALFFGLVHQGGLVSAVVHAAQPGGCLGGVDVYPLPRFLARGVDVTDNVTETWLDACARHGKPVRVVAPRPALAALPFAFKEERVASSLHFSGELGAVVDLVVVVVIV